MPNKPTLVNWYDYPQYYDMAFRPETQWDADFIEAVFRKYSPHPVQRVLEPACGSGRLVVELAARGYRPVAFDLNEKMLAYVRRRIARRRFQAELFRADMTDFRLGRPADAAINMWNTFRHLTTDAAAQRHLRCVAASLKPRSLYVLGLHLLPLDASDESLERWTVQSGKTRVTVTIRVVGTDPRRHLETLRLSLRVRTPRRDLRIQSEFDFRVYTARRIRRLLARVPEFELCDVYDFWYEIDQPRQLNNEIADTVLILRRRA
jgi:SAM-dependent methyltransferase